MAGDQDRADAQSFVERLVAASEDSSLSPAELRAWMQQAALRLRNVEVVAKADADVQAAMDSMSGSETTKRP